MFELFHDTFKYGYNFKVNVKFKSSTKNSEKGLIEHFFFDFLIKFT